MIELPAVLQEALMADKSIVSMDLWNIMPLNYDVRHLFTSATGHTFSNKVSDSWIHTVSTSVQSNNHWPADSYSTSHIKYDYINTEKQRT